MVTSFSVKMLAEMYKSFASASEDGMFSMPSASMINYFEKVIEYVDNTDVAFEEMQDSLKWYSKKLEEMKNSKPIIHCKDCKYRDKNDSHRCTYDAPQALWQEREFNPGFITNDCYCWNAQTIVKCKDCIYKTLKEDSSGNLKDYCKYRKIFVNSDNYCSYCEPKGGAK